MMTWSRLTMLVTALLPGVLLSAAAIAQPPAEKGTKSAPGDSKLPEGATPVPASEWRKAVPNGQPFLEIPEGDFNKLAPAARAEMEVFTKVLIDTGKRPTAELAEAAALNSGLTWTDLAHDAAKYQGKVVTLKGWLKHLTQKESPPAAVADFVDHYYVGWFHTGFGGKNGVFVTFTELPKDVLPSGEVDLYVQLSGYFFKEFRYLTPAGPKPGLFVMARTFERIGPKVAGDKAPELTTKLLQSVRDDFQFPKTGAKDPDKVTQQEKNEIEAYSEALVTVAKVPATAFAAGAKENHFVTYSHLFQEPWKYRGKVVSIKGRLKRLRKEEAPVEARRQGVDFFYEGWIFPETKYSTPLCVAFAKLPDGVKIGENIDHEVRFEGYFFKRYLYLASDGKPMKTLFFFAPTFTVTDPPAGNDAGLSMTTMIVTGIPVVAAVTVILMGTLNWWFRRSDAAVKARLAAARASFDVSGDLRDEPPPEGIDPAANGHAFENDTPAPADADPGSPRFRL